MDRLPPLNAVRAFEAVARRLSITIAATELHVTPGAVSRQIRTLEDALGIQLLVRGHRQITLTRAGEDYYRAVTKAMDGLREATVRLTRRTRRTQLKVRAYTTFAMRWLIPRLSSFHAANAGIEVLLTASLDEVDFRREDIDGAIRLGDGKWSGANAYRLVPNILLPVCSPALAKQVRKPADLQRQVLLHSIARPEDWGFWLASTGADKLVDARSGMTYQSSAMAYMAALEGQGFAIAQRFLVEDDLTSGKLVAPFRQAVDMGDFTYYLLTPADRAESTSMATFRAWLLAQFQGTAAG
ncbi:Glycine cleavage system transcriptional activator [compost metagenome]|uniref:Transcriptional regulator GcvA n=1 Tax=Cupriavidus campinensis TaxID=151783 RepID=A0AAE9L4B0_9BURK|nr:MULTISPECIES: transcriptional regulator GcvA [Cupriavidus]TSP13890.1 transcriptional regulator GcvA [Cupriavidus campinensis]URF06461.1 transcriptional regulator GcvA [Cupriavidus campinensis]CAG2134608.1 Glycine cleavage system transcriptional activator [Cupriavidus campinensis]